MKETDAIQILRRPMVARDTADEVGRRFAAIVDGQSIVVDLEGLAGPNDYLELIANLATWTTVLHYALRAVGPFTGRLLERSADALADKLFGKKKDIPDSGVDRFNIFSETIRSLVENNVNVVLTLKSNEDERHNVSASLEAGTPHEIAEAICSLTWVETNNLDKNITVSTIEAGSIILEDGKIIFVAADGRRILSVSS